MTYHAEAWSDRNTTPLLGEGEAAWNFGSSGSRWWTAELFPFHAEVSTYNIFGAAPFRWELRLLGAASPFASGEAAAWSAAFEAVGAARRVALDALRGQLT